MKGLAFDPDLPLGEKAIQIHAVLVAVAAAVSAASEMDRTPENRGILADLEAIFRRVASVAERAERDAYDETTREHYPKPFILYWRPHSDYAFAGTLRDDSADLGSRNVGNECLFSLEALESWARNKAASLGGHVAAVTDAAIGSYEPPVAVSREQLRDDIVGRHLVSGK